MDLVFIVTYDCPRCGVALEDRATESPTWLCCPRCGRASLPPEHQRQKPSTTKGPFSNPGVSTTVGSPSLSPVSVASGSKASNLRLFLGIGFFASLFLCVFSMLDSNGVMAGTTGVASMICLILLFVTGSRASRD